MKTPFNTNGDLEAGRGTPTMVARNVSSLCSKPRLVFGYVDSTHAALSCRSLRRQGWEVHLASSAAEARRLTQALDPEVIVLDTDLRDESGWLTCAKLVAENPERPVVLVAPDAGSENQKLAAFAGASTLVARGAGPAALVDEILGRALGQAV
jgi:DNA-binding response OmpR family regulator